jgi:hypothetical protein
LMNWYAPNTTRIFDEIFEEFNKLWQKKNF